MKDWQHFFEPHILYRGSEYYLENRVNHLEVRDQVCTAQVQGS